MSEKKVLGGTFCHLWSSWIFEQIFTSCSDYSLSVRCPQYQLIWPLPSPCKQIRAAGPKSGRGAASRLAEYAPVLVSSNHGTATNPRTPSSLHSPARPHKSRHYVAHSSRTFMLSRSLERRKTLHSNLSTFLGRTKLAHSTQFCYRAKK